MNLSVILEAYLESLNRLYVDTSFSPAIKEEIAKVESQIEELKKQKSLSV